MKTIKTKGKSSKKSNGRFGRMKFVNKDSSNVNSPDLSQLRKPVETSVSSLVHIAKLLEIGNEEVKSLLTYECDVIYECRVCGSLYRSLANFLSHKRVYCRDKFNIALKKDWLNNNNTIGENKLNLCNGTISDESREKGASDRLLRSQTLRKETKADLTSILDIIQQKKNETLSCNVSEPSKDRDQPAPVVPGEEQIILEKVESNPVAVYQTIVEPTISRNRTVDLMKTQVTELLDMANQNTAVLGTAEQLLESSPVEKSDNPLQIYAIDDDDDDDDVEEPSSDVARNLDLVCSICNAKFSTKKTLTCHMKSLHVSYRMCYPCPCCASTFANTWSVYRHLYKVHRKTNEQVRKLRSQIQERAFRKETTGAEDLLKESQSCKLVDNANRKTVDETQEWMHHLESDFELQRCGGCGRRFDRRAALLSHSQHCRMRIATRSEATSKSRKSANVVTPQSLIATSSALVKETHGATEVANEDAAELTCEKLAIDTNIVAGSMDIVDPISLLPVSPSNEANAVSELSIRVHDVSSLSKADWEKIAVAESFDEENIASVLTPPSENALEEESRVAEPLGSLSMNDKPDSPEIIFTSIDDARAVTVNVGNKKRKVNVEGEAARVVAGENHDRSFGRGTASPVGSSLDRNNASLMESKIASIANLRKLQCLTCKRKFTSMPNLRRHMATHIGWNRYRCKLCDFKCFVKCDCVAHCNRVHNARNNRGVLAEMVVQIPQDPISAVNGNEVHVRTAEEKTGHPEVIDVTMPESQGKAVGDCDKIQHVDVEFISEDDAVTLQSTLIGGNTDAAVINDAATETSKKSEKEKQDVEKPKETEVVSTDKNDKSQKNGGDPHQVQSKLDSDLELRRMVMEVIFGSPEMGLDKQPASRTANPAEKSPKDKDTAEGESSDSSSSVNDANGNHRRDGGKPQRPVRNRVKPVNKDFIYDLNEVEFRKETVLYRGPSFAASKSFTRKRHSSQSDENACDAEAAEEQSTKPPQLPLRDKIPSVVISRTDDICNKFVAKKPETAKLDAKGAFASSETRKPEVAACCEK